MIERVYRNSQKQVYFDVNGIPDLHRIQKETDSLTLGANITLSMAKEIFEKFMNESGFSYLKTMAEHIDLIASLPIRNIGTIAGNLMIKNQHHEFPSDMFLILETARAQIHILDSPRSKNSMMLKDFVHLDMFKKLIYSIVLPAMSDNYVYKTYKVMPRAQNAHAIINAGFLFKLDKNGNVLEQPNIIFGGINSDFLHASKTEEFLRNKSIHDVETLKRAFNILKTELNPDHVLPDFKPEFRQLLAVCLFYKFILNINSERVDAKMRSGGTMLQRELSSGKRDFDTDRNMWPVNQPMPKVGSIYQTSGEGEYTNDIPVKENEVFCAFVFAETPGTIKNIETEEAMNVDGVIAFYSAKDIPGKNLFIDSANEYFGYGDSELLFADKEVTYAGQAYGIIVASSQAIALDAASKVKLIYNPGSKQKPLITIHDVIESNDKTRIKLVENWPAINIPGTDVKHEIKGNAESGMQYHFTMEPQTCVCVPIEDGMDVFAATQHMDLMQTMIASVLNIPINSVNLKVRRLGGGYGAKISRANQIACACALVSHLLNKPARLVMKIEDNMSMVGKRMSAYFEYEVDVDDKAKIQRVNASYYGNVGSSFNESHAPYALLHFSNCYDSSTWSLKGFDVKTDIPSNTWCRAPGSAEGIAHIENIMERIARVTGKDPLEVRLNNLDEEDREALTSMVNELKKISDYENRVTDVEAFNKKNRWKKRGISLIPMKYPFIPFGTFHSFVSIYARDGTVSISTGGIEMGQGIHTKMMQIAAYTLGISLEMVTVKPSNCLVSPNDTDTGGSIGSDQCGYATQQACKELLKRLQPIKVMLGGNPSWKELVLTAASKNVDLCASFMFTVEQEIKPYPIYGATVSEVEVDVLTGQYLIRRVDILEDCGISLSPEIDVGQVEGAFVMGVGFWTSEDLIYDPNTGSLTNCRTWNYKIPGAKDIPVDFRVSFRRNAPNPNGILQSKATGEPPLCMACSVPIAIRHALDSARSDVGNNELWYQLDNAVTTEKILLNSLTEISALIL